MELAGGVVAIVAGGGLFLFRDAWHRATWPATQRVLGGTAALERWSRRADAAGALTLGVFGASLLSRAFA